MSVSTAAEVTAARGLPDVVPPVIRSTRARWPRVLAVVLIAAIAAAFTAQRFVATSHDLDVVRRDLAASRSHLARLRTDVQAAGVAENAAKRAAEHAVAVLDVERSRRVATNRNLVAAQRELAAVSHELATSLHIQQRQNDQVAALQRCLDGVSQAMNRVGVGDVRGWQSALGAVDADCRRAEEPA